MKRIRFTEEQIIAVLREQEAGAEDGRSGAQARHLGSHAVQLEGQVTILHQSNDSRTAKGLVCLVVFGGFISMGLKNCQYVVVPISLPPGVFLRLRQRLQDTIFQ
jgi:hypothetical protein